jgi:hypothetical protein
MRTLLAYRIAEIFTDACPEKSDVCPIDRAPEGKAQHQNLAILEGFLCSRFTVKRSNSGLQKKGGVRISTPPEITNG